MAAINFPSSPSLNQTHTQNGNTWVWDGTSWKTANPLPSPEITLAGDLSGSVTLTELGNGTLTATVAANSVALGADTTGNYVADISQGSGITVTHTPGEGSTATIAHADTSSAANLTATSRTYVTGLTFDTFGHVTSYTTGSETVTNTTYSISAETVASGANLRLTGSDATTDNVSIIGGTNVTVSRTDENTITISANDTSVDWSEIQNKPDPVITLAGDLSGSVTLTDLTSGTLTATIAANSVALGTDTTGNYVASIADGTPGAQSGSSGLTISATAGEGTAATIAHADTSSVSNLSSDNSNGVVLQDLSLTFDGFGHVTGATVATVDLDGRYYTETEADNRFVNVDGDTMTGFLTLHSNPTNSLHAATKQYVDTIAAASIHYHAPVRVESPTALNATYNNGSSGVGATLTNAGTQAALVIDGITVAVNDRVLVYNQANAAHNGVYTVTNVGSVSTNWVLTRATDADSYAPSDSDSFGQGDAFYVKEGLTGAGELYVMNTSGAITFGTTAISFTQISSAQIYSAGTGLTLTGTQFSVNSSQTQITSVGTLTTGTWNASVIDSTYGGTGVNNGGRTLTLNTGNLTLTAQAGGSSVTVPSSGTLAVLGTSQTFTAAQTFRAASAIRSEAASTQDAVVLAGRAGGTGSFAVTLTPTTLSANRTVTLANGDVTMVAGTMAVLGTAQTFTAAQTFRAANSIRAEAASTQDAVILAGRAGGTSSFAVTLTPTTLTASRTLTLPDATGTVALTSNIPTVNDGTLTLGIGTAGATNTTVTVATGTGFSANTATNTTYNLSIGPALTNLASTMTGATTGFLKKTAADTYTLDTATYLTAQSSDFGTITVTDTDSGNTWSATGSAVADTAGDTLTIVSGPGIDVDVSPTTDAIRIAHADTSSVANLSSDNSGNTFIQDISFTFDTYGHVTAASVVTGTASFTDTNTTYTLDGSGTTNSVNLELVAGGSGSGTDSINVQGSGITTVAWDEGNQRMTITSTEADTLATVTGRGATTSTEISITNTTDASSTGTGALIVSGGVGVAKNLHVGVDLVVGGNLTVNGTTTSVNSSTLVVDDKNIEIGSVTNGVISTTGTVGSITGTGPWTATITGMTSTAGLIIGSAITATNNGGSLGGGGTYIVASIVSTTSITYTATGGTTPVAGSVTNITSTGATNITADGGGITLKGTTDKTFNWVNSTAAWTSSENIALAAGKNIVLSGATSGTITLTPTAIAGTTTLTLPATTGTVALTSNIGDGTLSIATKTAGATNTDVTLNLSGAYSANSTTNRTINAVVGPALTALATTMTGAGTGFLRKNGADTYSLDTNTYLTSQSSDFGTFAINGTDSGYTWGTANTNTNQVADTTGDTLTFVKGGGINLYTNTVAGTDAIKIEHADTSSVTNVSSDNSNGVVIQDVSLTFDTYGHVTAASVTTVDLDTRYSATSWTVTTTAVTAVNGSKIIANTSGGAFTITLPATPATGSSVTVADGGNWSTNNLTIGRNGSTIAGVASNYIISNAGNQVEFVYNGTTWLVFGNVAASAVTADEVLATSLAIGDEF